uniref:interleukin-6 receptor subunit beta-like n=1 Tax=Pristiophorus japonicus TaxID=55135 RepID=UPI00398E44F3
MTLGCGLRSTMLISAGSIPPGYCLIFLLSLLTGADSEVSECIRISVSANNVCWGSPLAAACTVTNTSCFVDPIAHASQILWRLDNRDIPRTQYTIVNKTLSQLNIPAFNQTDGMLSCQILQGSRVTLQCGVRIQAGFPPDKPTNLSCVTTLKDGVGMTCTWDPGRDTCIPTNYTLRRIKNLAMCHNHEANAEQSDCVSLDSRSCTVPRHMLRLFSTDDISVLAQNVLGSTESDVLCLDAMDVVKLERPVISSVRGDPASSHCLIIRWELDMKLRMRYQLEYRDRYQPAQRQMLGFVNGLWREQRLCQLSAGTEYRVRLRCSTLGSMGYWSDWSLSRSGCTSESPPVGIPDVWWHVEDSNEDGNMYIRLFWKELREWEMNGRIKGYRVTHTKPHTNHHEITLCNTHNLSCRILAPGEGNISIRAYNSAGESPAALLPVETLRQTAFPALSLNVSITPMSEYSLRIEWSVPRVPVIGYVIEWCEMAVGFSYEISWKKESPQSSGSVLRENIEPMKRYAISIYPLHWKGRSLPVSTEAYSRQGAPLIGPRVSGNRIWKSQAEVMWDEIPIDKRQGFIRNYTIFHSDKKGPVGSIVCSALKRRYMLTGLLADTDYQVQVMATTDAGGTNGSAMNLTTMKSDDGGLLPVLAWLCPLVLLLMSLLLLMCFLRQKMTMGKVWPKIPNPANSSLAGWTPGSQAQVWNCSEGTPDCVVSSLTLLYGDTGKNTAFARKSMHLVEDEKAMRIKSDGQSTSSGDSLSESPAVAVGNGSGMSQYATVLHYEGHKAPPILFLRSDSTQPLLHELTPSPKPYEKPWFTKYVENDGELSQDISLSDVIVGEEAIWKIFPLLWGLESEHNGDTW